MGETQRLLDSMFLSIIKEDMILEHDFVMLSTRMEREHVVQKEPLKKMLDG
jgi:hypothetical protein